MGQKGHKEIRKGLPQDLHCPLQWLFSAAKKFKECSTSPGTPPPPVEHLLGALALCLGQPAATSPVQVPVISDGRGSAEQESRGPGAHGYSWELAAFLSHVGA